MDSRIVMEIKLCGVMDLIYGFYKNFGMLTKDLINVFIELYVLGSFVKSFN